VVHTQSVFPGDQPLVIGMWNTVAVTTNFRRFFAFLSACGIAVNTVAYVESFSLSPADAMFRWWIVLVPGWIALLAPIYVLEYPASRGPSFALYGFARGMPVWVAPCAWLLSLIAAAHLAWLAVHAGWGVPEIRDGQYVLTSNGRTLEVLTQTEYVKLRAAGARMGATAMIDAYFIPMTYWWFRRNQACASPCSPIK
jgi:hypothetical protein